MKKKRFVYQVFIILFMLLCGCGNTAASGDEIAVEEVVAGGNSAEELPLREAPTGRFSTGKAPEEEIPAFSGMPYYILNDNQPLFGEEDLTTEAFESYSELDAQGRCGVAYANICVEIMPDEERQSIGPVKPSGWHTVKYNDLVEGDYLYNRCHLIAYQLAGENANEKNLITGTRYLNVQGMLPFENMVADYVKETKNHVLYRVTPVFENENLVASGVEMEAMSVEDNGQGICFHVYVYNCQPGIVIDYRTGESEAAPDGSLAENRDAQTGTETYILNIKTHKFHKTTCSSVRDMADENKEVSSAAREEIIQDGYEPCKRCNP